MGSARHNAEACPLPDELGGTTLKRVRYREARAGAIWSVPRTSPETSRASCWTHPPRIHPLVMTPLRRPTPAFQSTIPSKSAEKERPGRGAVRDQCARTCQTGFAACAGSSTCRSASVTTAPPSPSTRPLHKQSPALSTPANSVRKTSRERSEEHTSELQSPMYLV